MKESDEKSFKKERQKFILIGVIIGILTLYFHSISKFLAIKLFTDSYTYLSFSFLFFRVEYDLSIINYNFVSLLILLQPVFISMFLMLTALIVSWKKRKFQVLILLLPTLFINLFTFIGYVFYYSGALLFKYSAGADWDKFFSLLLLSKEQKYLLVFGTVFILFAVTTFLLNKLKLLLERITETDSINPKEEDKNVKK